MKRVHRAKQVRNHCLVFISAFAFASEIQSSCVPLVISSLLVLFSHFVVSCLPLKYIYYDRHKCCFLTVCGSLQADFSLLLYYNVYSIVLTFVSYCKAEKNVGITANIDSHCINMTFSAKQCDTQIRR